MYFSNPEGWNIITTDRLKRCADHLSGVEITSLDFEEVLAAPGDSCVIYCDPPYVVDTELSESSKLYEFGFTIEDHIRFMKAVKACKHKVIISYDDHPLVRGYFTEGDGFNLYKEEWAYCGTSSPKGKNRDKKIGQELIITNFND